MFLYFSVFVNLVFIYFVYLLHYKSFILQTRKGCGAYMKPLTKRVVLFVPQGLGSDFLYNVTYEDGPKRSFLRRIIEEGGIWGISRTESPPVSQLGNVAIISGVTYDSSLIWSFSKLTNFQLDHAFNHANVFFMGDAFIPDLINAQEKGWSVHTWNQMFEKEIDEGGNYFAYDEFTFDQLDFLFKDETHKVTKGFNSIYVFYLPGVDYCSYKYMNLQNCVNIVINLDRQIEKVYKRFMQYYNDSDTTFILTSNEGNSWNCGESNSVSEDTPIIAWGAGIKKINKTDDPYYNRVDIRQIDMAPLISTLLGHEIPNNSMGAIPYKMLNLNTTQISQVLYCNEHQINQVLLKYAQETGNTDYLDSIPNDGSNVSYLREEFMININAGNYSEANAICDKLLYLHNEQISLYKKYLKPLTYAILIFIYVGFALWSLERVASAALLPRHDFTPKRNFWDELSSEDFKNNLAHDLIYHIIFAVIGITLSVYVYFKDFPLYFAFSCLLIAFIWWRVFINAKSFITTDSHKEIMDKLSLWFVYSVVGIIFITIGVNHSLARQFLLAILAITMIFTSSPFVENILQVFLVILTIIVIFFQNFNIGDVEFKVLIVGVISWILSMGYYVYYNRGPFQDIAVIIAYFTMTLLSLWNITNEETYTLISWIILSISLILPMLSLQKNARRLCHVCFSFCAPFVLLSVYEELLGLFFYSAYVVVIYCIEMRNADACILEKIQRNGKKRNYLDSNDLKRGYFLLSFIWFGYFATGNENYPEKIEPWVNFFTTYEKFPVFTLLAYKMLIPVVITCSAFGLMYKQLNATITHLLEWFLFLNGIVCLYFFINTKGEGNTMVEIAMSVTNLSLSHLISISVIVLIKFLDVYNRVDFNGFFTKKPNK